MRRQVRKDQENKQAGVHGKSHAAFGEKREAARGASSAMAIIQGLARNNAQFAEADSTRHQIAVVPRRPRRKARLRRATAREDKGKEIRMERTEERQAGKVSHNGDKEAGKETAKEAREERTLERATKSRTQ